VRAQAGETSSLADADTPRARTHNMPLFSHTPSLPSL